MIRIQKVMRQATRSITCPNPKMFLGLWKPILRQLLRNFRQMRVHRGHVHSKTGPLTFFLGSCFYRQQSWSSQAAMLTEKKK